MPHPVHYTVTLADPEAQLLQVRCRIARPNPEGQVLSMAAWLPGSYKIRDFARHIVAISARDADGPCALTQLDKHTWRCAPTDGALCVDATVYAGDFSVRGAHFDSTHTFFNGSALFLKVHGQEDLTTGLHLPRPDADALRRWRVSIALPGDALDEFGFGDYQAQNFDELLDSPCEIGAQRILRFQACGTPHELAIYGRLHPGSDLERLRDDLAAICEHHIRLFGEPAPMARYVFLLTVTGYGYGGLEHRASSANLCSRADLPSRSRRGERPDNGYQRLLGLLSHEYFHTWNVKRIKPAAFVPYDLRREAYTRMLWVFEGITSYYDDLALLRSDRITIDAYLQLLGDAISRVYSTPGRQRQTLEASSFTAWTKFYQQDDNAPNAIVSYYTKGAVTAMALDLQLRAASHGRRSLDDVMRLAWARFGDGRGMPEDGFEALVNDCAETDLSDFFNTALRSTDDLDLATLLHAFGIRLRWRPATGTPPQRHDPSPPPVQLGATLRPATAQAVLKQVLSDSPAQRGGLAPGDELIAIDGLKITAANLNAHLQRYAAGAAVDILAFRRDELMAVNVTLTAAPLTTAHLALDDAASGDCLEQRIAWLGG